MNLKQKVILNKKEYVIRELTVWLYYLFLLDFTQFIEDIFLEFNKEIPKMNEEQLRVFFLSYFDTKDNNKSNKNIPNEENIEILLINIWKFMKFFWNTYEDILNIPFKVFTFMFENIEVITGEKDFIYSKNKEKEDKKKLKNLFNNI